MRGRSSGRSLDAAALQSDMAKRFNLPGAAVKRVKYLVKTNSYNGREKRTVEHCPSCAQEVSTSDSTCPNCGIFFRSLREFEPTLSERRGLVKPAMPAVVVMAQEEWVSLETKLFERKECVCPICMENFKDGNEVLLSCSHMYHRNCLHAFEKFMKNGERCCPVCRTTNYQKKITRVGSRCYQIHCTIKIQTIWRGYLVRCKYYQILRTFYKQGNGIKSTRKKFYEKEFIGISKQVVKDVDDMNKEVNSMLQSSDAILSEGRELDALFNQMLAQRSSGLEGIVDSIPLQTTTIVDKVDECQEPDEEIKWKDIWNVAQERGLGDCAVCMCSNGTPSKQGVPVGKCGKHILIALLTCSHVFHEKCLTSFEIYRKDDIPMCPMCRSPYDKKIIKVNR